MQVQYLTSQDELKEVLAILALGFFDGMHTAHQRILSETIALAKEKNVKAAMMTFDTHVLSFLKQVPFRYLTSLNDKIKLAQAWGFDIFYVLKVDASLVRMEAQSFIDQFLKGMKEIVVGFDFTFGRRGLGNVDLLLSDPSLHTTVIQELTYYRSKIGSTRIRDSLKEGKIPLANHLLGRPYQIEGTVIHGKGRGKYLGFPTANLDYQGYLLPKSGVYLVHVSLNSQSYFGLVNVGDNPTFKDKDVTLEVYIMDFNQTIYGEILTIQFEQFLRDEETFSSKFDLIEQMKKDELQARQIIKERKL